MKDPNYYRLRPYHNPDNVDESKVPPGWRFRYADEMNKTARGPCRMYSPDYGFSDETCYFGLSPNYTYTVSVDC